MADQSSSDVDELVYAIIGNIPPNYHSSDLRNFFSQFLEGKGFDCFHFRHRPEQRKEDESSERQNVATTTTSQTDEIDTCRAKKNRTTCCVVRLKTSKCHDLIKMYHQKHWLDKNGDSIPSVCVISKVKLKSNKFSCLQSTSLSRFERRPKNNSLDIEQGEYKTRKEQKEIPGEREEFTDEDLSSLKELHPPDVMPNGNVGTPTLVFLEFIKQCRLPPIIIKKLGLSFPKTRTNKKYGSVPFDYGGKIIKGGSNEDCVVRCGKGKELLTQGEIIPSLETASFSGTKPGMKETKAERLRRKEMMLERIEEKMIGGKDEGSGEDNDSCEEWERHEALYDDPTNQERNNERLFEEEIELKWEKGGSGLVFYTDAQFWDQKEGDFDEKTADDWDVDMSVYYEPGAGDMDAKDYVKMRQEKRRRDGIEDTDFQTVGIGKFEKFTKGFGRRILTKQGWTDGEGLGCSVQGMSEALENDGQNPKDRKGFGYRGEKLVRYSGVKRRADKDVIISTIYDDPALTDPTEPLLRRHEHYGLKYRQKIAFTKSQEENK